MDNTVLFILLLVAFALFMLGRELLTWYFKLNKVVALLQRHPEGTRDELATKP
jgi:hypothetical protein